MTDRYNALIVVLDKDIRDDDAVVIINAIQQIKHVLTVKGNVADIDSDVAESRIKLELTRKLYEVLK